MGRVSHEGGILLIMPEISCRPSFYYTTPLFSPSTIDKRLDYLLGEYQKKESFKVEGTLESKIQPDYLSGEYQNIWNKNGI